MSRLKGTPELKRRLKAIGQTFKPVGRQWADKTVIAAAPKVPVKTGRLRGSFRRSTATAKRARVVGHYTAYFIDAGVVPHSIKAKRTGSLVFQGRHGTVFAKAVHHRGFRARPFRERAAREGLRNADMAAQMINLWNKAA